MTRGHVCLTCGRIKVEELFEEGDCTCQDCYNEDRHSIRWKPDSDGDGFVYVGGENDA